MKTLLYIIILNLVSLLLFSCYCVEQNILIRDGFNHKTLETGTRWNLETVIWIDGEKLWVKKDDITDIKKDSIMCLRIDQAKNIVFEHKQLYKTKCR